jgi:hypothetical protein
VPRLNGAVFGEPEAPVSISDPPEKPPGLAGYRTDELIDIIQQVST